MEQSSQDLNYNYKNVISPHKRTNYNSISQKNILYNQNKHPNATKRSEFYASEKNFHQFEQKKNNINVQNKEDLVKMKDNKILQRNQIYIPQNTLSDKVGTMNKRIYFNGNKLNEINENLEIKSLMKNKINKKGGLKSLINYKENYPNLTNISRRYDESFFKNKSRNENNYLNNEKENEIKVRENFRFENKESPNKDYNHRAISNISERKQIKNLSLPKYLENEKIQSSSAEVRRKTITRGGHYNNIQVTHIYVSTKSNIDKYNFHIMENLSTEELDKAPLDLKQIRSKIKQNKNAKSVYKSSCEGRVTSSSSKDKMQKTTIFQHAGGMGMTNLEANMINSNLYTSGLRQIPQKIKEKNPPVIQVIDLFRSHQNNSNINRSINTNYINSDNISFKYNKNNINNKSYNILHNQIMNKSNASIKNNLKNYKSNQKIINNKLIKEQNNKINITDYKSDIITNKNSKLSNYYKSLPTNKNYFNIKKNNILIVNIGRNTSNSKNINQNNQTNPNKNFTNSSCNSNQAIYKNAYSNQLEKKEIYPQRNSSNIYNSKINQINLTDQKESRTQSHIYTQNKSNEKYKNNIYPRTESKEDYRNNNRVIQISNDNKSNVNSNKRINSNNKFSININIKPSENYKSNILNKKNIKAHNYPKKFETKSQLDIFSINNPMSNQKNDVDSISYLNKRNTNTSTPNLTLNNNNYNLYNRNSNISTPNTNKDFNKQKNSNNNLLPPKAERSYHYNSELISINKKSSSKINTNNFNNKERISYNRNNIYNNEQIPNNRYMKQSSLTNNINEYNNLKQTSQYLSNKITPKNFGLNLCENERKSFITNNNKNEDISTQNNNINNSQNINKFSNIFNRNMKENQILNNNQNKYFQTSNLFNRNERLIPSKKIIINGVDSKQSFSTKQSPIKTEINYKIKVNKNNHNKDKEQLPQKESSNNNSQIPHNRNINQSPPKMNSNNMYNNEQISNNINNKIFPKRNSNNILNNESITNNSYKKHPSLKNTINENLIINPTLQNKYDNMSPKKIKINIYKNEANSSKEYNINNISSPKIKINNNKIYNIYNRNIGVNQDISKIQKTPKTTIINNNTNIKIDNLKLKSSNNQVNNINNRNNKVNNTKPEVNKNDNKNIIQNKDSNSNVIPIKNKNINNNIIKEIEKTNVNIIQLRDNNSKTKNNYNYDKSSQKNENKNPDDYKYGTTRIYKNNIYESKNINNIPKPKTNNIANNNIDKKSDNFSSNRDIIKPQNKIINTIKKTSDNYIINNNKNKYINNKLPSKNDNINNSNKNKFISQSQKIIPISTEENINIKDDNNKRNMPTNKIYNISNVNSKEKENLISDKNERIQNKNETKSIQNNYSKNNLQNKEPIKDINKNRGNSNDKNPKLNIIDSIKSINIVKPNEIKNLVNTSLNKSKETNSLINKIQKINNLISSEVKDKNNINKISKKEEKVLNSKIDNDNKKSNNKIIEKDFNNETNEIKKISLKVASKITNEYINNDKAPSNLEVWQQLKHNFKKWKNVVNNYKDLIINPQYVAWFRRNCDNRNIPELSKIEKINEFLYFNIDELDENNPIKIDNFINKINKQRESYESMPYDEWFNKHCEKSSISNIDFTLPKPKKYILNKITEIPLILKDFIEHKSNSDINTNNTDEKKNNPYNGKEIKDIYNLINGLKSNKQKKYSLSSLRNNVDNNEIKKYQINKLNDLFEIKLKKEGINQIIEKNKNPKKKEILRNIVNLWNEGNEEEKNFFENIEYETLKLLPKEEKMKKINDIYNESQEENEKINEDNSINKLAIILDKFDKKEKEEILKYLKENNKNPENEGKLNTLNNLLDKKEKEYSLIKILGGNNIRDSKEQKRKENDKRINLIIDNLNNLDNKSKSNIIQYMKDTTKDNEDKKKDLELILNNINVEEESYDSKNTGHYANDGSFSQEKENNYYMRYNFGDNEEEKYLSITIDSLKTEEDINLDDLNISKNELEQEENISVFYNDDELLEIVNEIDEENKNIKKNLDNEEFDFMVEKMLNDLLINKNNNIKEDNKEDEKQKFEKVLNVINQLNKKDQIKAIKTMKNLVNKDEKKKDIIKNLQNKVKKIWNSQKIIKNILEKKKTEENEEMKEKEKNKNYWNISNEKIERVTSELLSNLIKGETDFDQEKNYNLKSSDIKDDENGNLTFIEKERIDKAAETLNDLNKNQQEQIIQKLREKMKKPKQKTKLDKLCSTLKNLNKIKELKNKIKKKNQTMKDIKIEEQLNSDRKEKLPEKEINDLTKGFMADLFKEEKEPKTRDEKREIYKEKKKRISNVAKSINNLNKKDQKIVLEKLNKNANDEKKKEQYNKLNNLIKSNNNLKSYINKLIKEKINEDKNKNKDNDNKKNELCEKDIEELNKKFIEDLFPDKNNEINDTKVDDKHLKKIYEEKIKEIVDIIKELNSNQQKKILENIKSKAAEQKNLEIFKKIIKKLKSYKKINNIIEKLSKDKKGIFKRKETIDDSKSKISKNIELEEIDEKYRKKTIQLKEEEFNDLVENVLNNLLNEEKKNSKNKEEENNNEKEKEKEDNNKEDMKNNLDKNDKEEMLQETNDNSAVTKGHGILKNLNSKVKHKKHHKKKEKINEEESNYIYDLIIAFNNNRLKEFEEERELNDKQLGGITKDVITELFKEDEKNDKNEKEKSINKAANVIKDLNKNDQTKVLSVLNENANNENKKGQILKVNNLVNSMNEMKQYLKGIMKRRISSGNIEMRELEKDKLDNLTKNILNDLYKNDNNDENNKKETSNIPPLIDEKLNNIANTLNKLNENDKKKIINILEENAKNCKRQKTLSDLKNKMTKIYEKKNLDDNSTIKDGNKEEKEKPKLSDEEIRRMANKISADLYGKGHRATNSFEDIIMNENKENKIKEMAESMKSLDKDTQEKALLIINKNAIDDEQKEKANKLSNLVKNLDNMKIFFGNMIKKELNKEEEEKNKNNILYEQPLEGDLYDDDIRKITNSFLVDLNKYNKNINEENINDIINSYANIIKELKPEDQAKALKILKDKREEEKNKIKGIDNLEKKIIDLNNMKKEIKTYEYSIFKNEINFPTNYEQEEDIEKPELIENKEIIIEILEEKNKTNLNDERDNNKEIKTKEENNKINDENIPKGEYATKILKGDKNINIEVKSEEIIFKPKEDDIKNEINEKKEEINKLKENINENKKNKQENKINEKEENELINEINKRQIIESDLNKNIEENKEDINEDNERIQSNKTNSDKEEKKESSLLSN